MKGKERLRSIREWRRSTKNNLKKDGNLDIFLEEKEYISGKFSDI